VFSLNRICFTTSDKLILRRARRPRPLVRYDTRFITLLLCHSSPQRARSMNREHSHVLRRLNSLRLWRTQSTGLRARRARPLSDARVSVHRMFSNFTTVRTESKFDQKTPEVCWTPGRVKRRHTVLPRSACRLLVVCCTMVDVVPKTRVQLSISCK
jgi:hypothetical protein